jgi:putative ABC transport system substrate-binding protein
MLTRRFLLTSLAGSLVAPLGAEAQRAGRLWQIGLLGPNPLNPALRESLKEGLGQLGYTEGQRLLFVDRHADSALARLPAVTTALVRDRPDVILARGPAAVAAAARATTTIPIVAVDLESDPLALGYAKTLARPGGNVTGVFLDLPDLSAKQLQLFREIVPGISRVSLVGDSIGNAAQFRATEHAAKAIGIQVQKFEGRTTEELDAALEAARRHRAGVVLIFSSPAVFYNLARIVALAHEKRLPTVSLFTEFAQAGGLLTYGPSLRDCFRRCGIYIAKILNGAMPADLPIERPQAFELVINAKTGKALGLAIPPSLLARADQVIE